VIGWSTGPMGNWLLETSVLSTNAPPFAKALHVEVESSLGLDNPGGDGCPLGPAMNNGESATLYVTIPAGTPSGAYGVIGLKSTKQAPFDSSSGACVTPLSSDVFHEWPIGVYVP
jgi:hypothetical protein